MGVEFAPWNDHAVVLLQTNEAPAVEWYQVVCERREGEWFGLVGGNGPCEVSLDGIRVSTHWRELGAGQVGLAVEWSRDV